MTKPHAGADAPAGKLCELGLSLNGKVPDAAWACVGVTTLSLKGNHLGSLSPKLAQLSALRVLGKIDAFAATTTANGGWVRG